LGKTVPLSQSVLPEMVWRGLTRILTPWTMLQEERMERGSSLLDPLILPHTKVVTSQDNSTITIAMPSVGLASNIPRYTKLLTFQNWVMPRCPEARHISAHGRLPDIAAKALNPPNTKDFNPFCSVNLPSDLLLPGVRMTDLARALSACMGADTIHSPPVNGPLPCKSQMKGFVQSDVVKTLKWLLHANGPFRRGGGGGGGSVRR